MLNNSPWCPSLAHRDESLMPMGPCDASLFSALFTGLGVLASMDIVFQLVFVSFVLMLPASP